MSTQGHSATAEPSDHGLIVRIVYQQRPERPDALEQRLDAELAEQRLILSAQERSLLEEHLEKEVAANFQRMIRDTEERVAAINVELYKRPTSTGMRYRLVWEALPENDENPVPGLAVARKRLFNTSADAWSAQDRRQVGEFLRARIDAERQRDERGTLYETLARALDYRRWHPFSVERNQDRQWKPLSGPASSGERALGLTVPLFAAASSHYESSDPHAPRLVLLDEAFAGIDDEARASCMGLIREFDLDFVMTSEREWGCYAETPGLEHLPARPPRGHGRGVRVALDVGRPRATRGQRPGAPLSPKRRRRTVEVAVDVERLQRLLGGPDLAGLRRRLRTRFEKGAARDEFTLIGLSAAERRALAGLLGRRPAGGDAGSMRMRLSDIDAALLHAGVASTLREALEALDGPIHDLKAARVAREEAWSALLTERGAPPTESIDRRSDRRARC